MIRAAWVLPVDQPPIENGAVRLAQHRIEAVGRFRELQRSGEPIVDLGDSWLLPGLVNAHTHLEFSDLHHPLGQPGMPFPQWIGAVVAHRQQAPPAPRDQVVARGLQEAWRSGTAVLGDIATGPAKLGDYGRLPGPALIVAFLEQLGRSPDRLAPHEAQLRAWLGCGPSEIPGVEPALSPHAPYSVSPALLEQMLRQAGEACVAMHLAESLEERQLTDSGSGPFVDLLRELGAWPTGGATAQLTIAECLGQLSRARRGLVVHGNYLTAAEMDQIAGHRDRMSVVFCPRTHAYFQHATYPLRPLCERDIRVALGTDSRASNPDLCLWQEMATVGRHHPWLNWEAILRMGTLTGAEALGCDREFGSLTPGKSAALSVLHLPADQALRRPGPWIWDSTAECRGLPWASGPS